MDFFAKHWGDLASLLGLAFTILALFMAKGARDAAREVRDRISNLDTVGELASAIAVSQEIMRLQRANVLESVTWHMVLERYGTLQLHLIRSSKGAALNDVQGKAIGTALLQFRIIKDAIEDAKTDDGRGQLDRSRFNRTISGQIEHIETVRIAVMKAEA